MENHTTEDFAGLESLGNSQSVTSISDFLSLEDLGLIPGQEEEYIPLNDVNKTTSSNTPPATPAAEPAKGAEPTVELPIIPKEEDGDLGLGSLEELDKGIEDIEEPIVPAGDTNYKSILSELIAEGILPGIEAFETEEGEVPFEEMDIDKETLLALIKQNQEDLKEELKSTSVDVNGISDFTKKLINIEKHGGNVQQALTTYQQVKHPIETLDLNDVAGQKAMCYLRFQAQGIEDSIAKDLINAYEMKGVLEDKALESKEQLDNAFIQSIAQQEELAIEQEKQYKAALKTYRATLDNVFKDQDISDTHRKKLLDVATKQTEEGDFELDILIDNFRKNPIDAADLIMFVTNKDEFIKKKSEAMVKEERIKTMKKISVITKGKSSSLAVPEAGTKRDPYLLDLNKL